MKNSCGKRRGCSVIIILPHDRRVSDVSARGIQRNTKKILSLSSIPLDEKLAKAA